MIEAPAGLLDEDDPAACIRRETEEETGYRVRDVRKVLEAYTSRGARLIATRAVSRQDAPR